MGRLGARGSRVWVAADGPRSGGLEARGHTGCKRQGVALCCGSTKRCLHLVQSDSNCRGATVSAAASAVAAAARTAVAAELSIWRALAGVNQQLTRRSHSSALVEQSGDLFEGRNLTRPGDDRACADRVRWFCNLARAVVYTEDQVKAQAFQLGAMRKVWGALQRPTAKVGEEGEVKTSPDLSRISPDPRVLTPRRHKNLDRALLYASI